MLVNAFLSALTNRHTEHLHFRTAAFKLFHIAVPVQRPNIIIIFDGI